MARPKARQAKAERRVRVVTAADLGALVREARERRGWTQTALGARVGASRFWVAEFERGKAGAELGLALRAVRAVGLHLTADVPAQRAAGGGEATRDAASGSATAAGASAIGAPAGGDAAAWSTTDAVRTDPAASADGGSSGGAATSPPSAGAALVTAERMVPVDLDDIVGTTAGDLTHRRAGAAPGASPPPPASPADPPGRADPMGPPRSGTRSGTRSASRRPARPSTRSDG